MVGEDPVLLIRKLDGEIYAPVEGRLGRGIKERSILINVYITQFHPPSETSVS